MRGYSEHGTLYDPVTRKVRVSAFQDDATLVDGAVIYHDEDAHPYPPADAARRARRARTTTTEQPQEETESD